MGRAEPTKRTREIAHPLLQRIALAQPNQAAASNGRAVAFVAAIAESWLAYRRVVIRCDPARLHMCLDVHSRSFQFCDQRSVSGVRRSRPHLLKRN